MTWSIKLLEHLQATWRLCQAERKDWDHNLMSDTEWCGFSRIWELEAGKEQSKSDDTSQSKQERNKAEVETTMILEPRELGDNASTHSARVQEDLKEKGGRKDANNKQEKHTDDWHTIWALGEEQMAQYCKCQHDNEPNQKQKRWTWAVTLMESQAAEGFQQEVMLKQKKTMNSTDHCCKQYHVVI